MPSCQSCGNQVPEDAKHCPHCGAALEAPPQAQEIKWGGAVQIHDAGTGAIVPGRSFGRFSGQVPAGQEPALKAIVLAAVNAALVASPVPLNRLAARIGELVDQVNGQLAPQLQPLGISGKVTDIMVDPDAQPQAPPAPAASAAPAEATGAGFPTKTVIAIVGAALLAAAGSTAFYLLKGKLFGKGRGSASYAQFGIDPKRADADAVTDAAAKLARRWDTRAVWWAVNINNVGEGGALDFTSGSSAQLTFIVPSRVTSVSKRRRQDAIKKIRFGPKTIDHKGRRYAKKRWKNVRPLPKPACTVSKLARALAQRGLSGAKKVRISFDPIFAFGPGAPEEPSWRVRGQDPKIDAWFSLASCELTRDRAAR